MLHPDEGERVANARALRLAEHRREGDVVGEGTGVGLPVPLQVHKGQQAGPGRRSARTRSPSTP